MSEAGLKGLRVPRILPLVPPVASHMHNIAMIGEKIKYNFYEIHRAISS